MGTVLTVREALPVLRKYFITDSEQVLTRWLRKKRLRGSSTSNRKEGWRISIEDLLAFIDQKRPGIREAFEQKEQLEDKVKVLVERLEQLERVIVQLHAANQVEENKEALRDIDVQRQLAEIQKANEDMKQDILDICEMLGEVELALGEQIRQVQNENIWMNEMFGQLWEEYKRLSDFIQEIGIQSAKLKNPRSKTPEPQTSKQEIANPDQLEVQSSPNLEIVKETVLDAEMAKTVRFKMEKLVDDYTVPKNRLTFEQFEEFVVNIIKPFQLVEDEQNFILLNMEKLHRMVFEMLFDEEDMRSEYYTYDDKNSKKYICPFTKKQYSYLSRMYKSIFMHQLHELIRLERESNL